VGDGARSGAQIAVVLVEDRAQRVAAVAQQMSGKEVALLRPPPLRTGRARCRASGSSLCGGEEIPGRTEHPILVSPYGRLSTPVLVQLAPSNISVG
jgi:hypothetical protein